MNQADRTCQNIIARLLTALPKARICRRRIGPHAASCPNATRLLLAAKRLQKELASEARPQSESRTSSSRMSLSSRGHFEEGRDDCGRRLLVFAALNRWPGAWLFGPVGGMLGVPEKVVILRGVAGHRHRRCHRSCSAPAQRGPDETQALQALKPVLHVVGRLAYGLAEATGVPVALIRFTFIVLTVAGGKIGIPFYFILSAALDVHPDDRQYMLKFKIQRWMKYLFSHSDSHPTHELNMRGAVPSPTRPSHDMRPPALANPQRQTEKPSRNDSGASPS